MPMIYVLFLRKIRKQVHCYYNSQSKPFSFFYTLQNSHLKEVVSTFLLFLNLPPYPPGYKHEEVPVRLYSSFDMMN